jgi:N-acetylglutamate synthase
MQTNSSTVAELPVKAEVRTPSCELRMRHYRTSDYAALRELWLRAGLKLDDTDGAEHLEQSMAAGRFAVIVVEAQVVHGDNIFENGWRLAGGVIVTYDGRRGYVYHLGVDAAYRGLGLGMALLEACEEQARQWGARHLRLTVRDEPSRAAAKKLYRQKGWRCDQGTEIFMKDAGAERKAHENGYH